MLVLSRRPGEQIVIGEGIVVTVIEVRGNKVRLGIEADKKTAVHRREVHNRIVLKGEDPLQKKTGDAA